MDDNTSSMLTGTADTLEDTKPSYWLDACEDISCDDLIPGDFPPVGLSSLQDASLDPCFFDGILDSIPTNANIVDAPLTMSSAIKVEEDTVASLLDASSAVSNGVCDGNNGNGFKKGNSTSIREPNKHRGYEVQGCHDEQERFGKRARVDSHSSGGRHLKERPCRKRARDYEEKDRRDRSSIRRRDQYSSNGRRGNREMDWREGRGYWERDRLGTNDMVFRPGSWEAGSNRDIKPSV